ncbi:hypothetical protein WD019_10805 [Fictibacillus sp. Mic-4]|nr:hypothetical protein [Fictibacillus gelatini]
MKILKKVFKYVFVANAAVILTIALLPALLITNDISVLQDVLEYISK